MRCSKRKNKSGVSALEALESRQMMSAAPLAVSFGSDGISMLSYKGTVLVDQAAKAGAGFWIPGVFTVVPNSASAAAAPALAAASSPVGEIPGQNPTGSSWNADKKVLNFHYTWGRIKVRYTTEAKEIDMAISVFNNTSDSTLNGLELMPLTLNFPTMPAGFNGGPQAAFGDQSPGVVVANYGNGTIALVNEDVDRPLYTAYVCDPETATQNQYMACISSAPIRGQPGSWPILQEPIAAQASTTYHLALRFGGKAATAQKLAADVLAKYAAANPDTVNWTNRNPIAYLTPAGSAPAGRSATNPNGWFNDPTVDVTTPAGLASFEKRLLAYATASVGIMKTMGAQGVITWDLEGEQYPNADYIGDPRVATTLAPELNYDDVVDQYFAIFRNAGLETGVTIRDAQFVDNNGDPFQVVLSNPQDEVNMLVSKIQYAMQQWGCTLFYIDSTNWASSPWVLQQVHQQCPGTLLIPENGNLGEYAVSAPYGDVRNGALGTPQLVKDIYPDAFSVINPAAGNLTQDIQNSLVQSVLAGDILMFGGWTMQGNNEIIKSIYTEAAIIRTPVAGLGASSPFSSAPILAGDETAAEILNIGTTLKMAA